MYQICQGLHGAYREILSTYWQASLRRLEDEEHDYKQHQLPLARIKKVMKADPEVKMISAEAPILFAKGCDIFITELTMRAWIHAEENKRRTLQRSDIAAALTKSDMFDFLIDIVPREEAGATHAKRPAPNAPQPQQMAQAMAPPPIGPQGGVSGQGPPSHEYGYAPSDHEYRPPPQMYQQPPQGDPNAAYSYPQGAMLNDPGMYGGYSMPPQPVYCDDIPMQTCKTNTNPDVSDATTTTAAAAAAATTTTTRTTECCGTKWSRIWST